MNNPHWKFQNTPNQQSDNNTSSTKHYSAIFNFLDRVNDLHHFGLTSSLNTWELNTILYTLSRIAMTDFLYCLSFYDVYTVLLCCWFFGHKKIKFQMFFFRLDTRGIFNFNVYGCANILRHWSFEIDANVDCWRNYHGFACVRIRFCTFLCSVAVWTTTTSTTYKLIIDGLTATFFLAKSYSSGIQISWKKFAGLHFLNSVNFIPNFFIQLWIELRWLYELFKIHHFGKAFILGWNFRWFLKSPLEAWGHSIFTLGLWEVVELD